MKVLIFEYITGGGFNKQALPDSLLGEGRLMLAALLENFSRITGVELVVMLDARLAGIIDAPGIATVTISPTQDCNKEFAHLARSCDAIWPIAPEFDGILEGLCQVVGDQNKLLLTSSADAVALTANKYSTYQRLVQHQIASVPTRRLCEARYEPGEWIVKAIDGAGCADSRLISGRLDFDNISNIRTEHFIIQPHWQGEKTSLSCLFKNGRGWLICVNLQQFDIIEKCYQLTDIIVNQRQADARYRDLIDRIAGVFPDLWGYAGIDLIETAEQQWVLEINPRLTTSFVGIDRALGINVAEQVLRLLDGEPVLNSGFSRAVRLKIQ